MLLVRRVLQTNYMNCDCGCHDTPGTLFCEVCRDGHVKAVIVDDTQIATGIPLVPVPSEDEFGSVHIQSDARMAHLKSVANKQFTDMCEVIKKSQSAMSGFAEWARTAETNEKRFHDVSKAYVETLKAIEGEGIKTRF